jgi:hypothetical protein
MSERPRQRYSAAPIAPASRPVAARISSVVQGWYQTMFSSQVRVSSRGERVGFSGHPFPVSE